MKTIALLLVVGAAPPASIDVRPLSFDDAFVKAHPCKTEPPKPEVGWVEQFCAGRARVVFFSRQNALVFTLEVFDAETGAKLHSVRTFGGAGADGEKVYFQTTDSVTHSIALAQPKEAPKKLGTNDCGGPAAPSFAAIANGVPLCLTRPDPEDHNRLVVTGTGPGVCYVPPGAWAEKGEGYALATEKLSKECRKVLKVR